MAVPPDLAVPALDLGSGLRFLRAVLELVLEEGVVRGTDPREKVCHWKDPAELGALLDAELREEGEGEERLRERCREVLRYSVRTGHPRFFNQLFAGLDPVALSGRFLTETLNTSPYTYEVAPVLVLLEDALLAKLRDLLGWDSGDGIFCPGGSFSNMVAMNLARFRRFPQSRAGGGGVLPTLALFASRECHFSIHKGAAFLGIGTDNVHEVATDERGKMIPAELEKAIRRARAQGSEPFLVCATSGTTVLGAFDPLGDIGDICQREGLWLHVDAAWGGGALLSQRYRHLLEGIERADSVVWNPHKILGVGLQCSMLLVRDSSGLLHRCHSMAAPYLYQPDKFYGGGHDPGDRSPLCGRRGEGLKLWLLWKAEGTRGLCRRVERAAGCIRYLWEEMKKREGFELVLEPEFLNLCFWFVPPSLRGRGGSPDYWEKLGKVAPAIKERMVRGGSMLVGYQPQGHRVNFFRLVVPNPATTARDLQFLLDEIERLGQDL